jgi:large subunit ribosomal protein L5
MLKEKYHKDVVPKMMELFGYKNPLQVPRLEKVTINMGVGEATSDAKALESAMEQLSTISGQRPVKRKARRSIAAFKLKAGQPIGCMVTLRGERMYDFLYRFINLALPRIRDFKGLEPTSFDGRGNVTIGVKEQIIFPEIEYDKVDKIRGMNITITTTAKTDEEGRQLLQLLGLPFKEWQEKHS